MNKISKSRKLVILGDSAFAEIAMEYFEADTDYAVVGFSVEDSFREKDYLNGLPVVDFSKINDIFPADYHEICVAVTYTHLNRLRARLAFEAKSKGYRLASYISPHAFVWRNATIGEHCFIFENNVIQPFSSIGDNVVIWSGNHIGHHSIIRNNCFISSHVVISGFCDVGENSFLGVNSTLANNVSLEGDNWIGPNVAVIKSIEKGTLIKAVQPASAKISALRFFKVESD
jgi:sugar O-acyltransferase (sialic acid O-acetyltransferase NeuD family)